MERIDGYEKQREYPLRIVLRESFTGDGSTKTFTLDGTAGNATFRASSWSLACVQTSLPAHVTKTNKKPAYDGLIPGVRNRIGVSSINSGTGVVTLDYAPRSGVEFYIWYWYELPIQGILEDYYREDFVGSMEEESGGGGGDAREVDTDTTNFGGILSAADDTVQKALDTTDDHTHDGRYYTETELDAGQLDTRYFTEAEHLNVSAGAADAGKPVKLDAAGHIDASMINDADVSHGSLTGTHNLTTDIDHGSISGLTDDDHTQYHNDTRGDARYYTETELDGGQLDNRYYTESEVDTAIDTDVATHAALTTTHGVSGTLVGTSDSQALTNKTYEGLTLTAAAVGFTIAGGTTAKTLTLNENFDASAQISAIQANTGKVTESTTVTAPLVLTTYDISIPAATSGNDGYMTSTYAGKLDGVAAGADVTGDNAPQAHAASHTDGSDDIQDATAVQKGLATAAQITKLDGIETGATKYPDTGEQAFLDADHTKLDGIEAAADVTDATNVDAAGAVMETDFNADTFLYAAVDNTPVATSPASAMAALSGHAAAAFSFNGQNISAGNITIPDAGTIGSASDTDAIAISSTGVLTFSGQSGCSVYLSADQDVPTASVTTLQFDSEDYDIQSEFNTGTYTYTASTAGKYIVALCAYTAEALNNGNALVIIIKKNAAEWGRTALRPGSNGVTGSLITIGMDLAANDTVTAEVYHTFGANREFDADYCRMTINKIT